MDASRSVKRQFPPNKSVLSHTGKLLIVTVGNSAQCLAAEDHTGCKIEEKWAIKHHFIALLFKEP